MRIPVPLQLLAIPLGLSFCACCTRAPIPSPPTTAAPSQTTGAPVPPPRESVDLPLASSTPAQAFGVSIALASRTHKQFKDPALGVVGVWSFRIEKIGSTAPGLDENASGPSLHLEGAGFGATWIIQGDYENEHVTILRGESAALEVDRAMQLAESATGHAGGTGPRSSSVQSGVLDALIEDGPRKTRVRVGLHSGSVISVEELGAARTSSDHRP